jgi:hypothetical protein
MILRTTGLASRCGKTRTGSATAGQHSTGVCTRLVSSVTRCRPPAIERPPLLATADEKTQRVAIHDNRFSFDPGALSPDAKSMCGTDGSDLELWQQPTLVRRYHGKRVQRAITLNQENSWYRNTYVGPWSFTTLDPQGRVTPDQWRSARRTTKTERARSARAGLRT